MWQYSSFNWNKRKQNVQFSSLSAKQQQSRLAINVLNYQQLLSPPQSIIAENSCTFWNKNSQILQYTSQILKLRVTNASQEY